MGYHFYPDPRQDPANAQLPNVNQPETILGVTISMLVGGVDRSELERNADCLRTVAGYSGHDVTIMGTYSRSSLGMGRCLCLACGSVERHG